jgi:hypothetical protein
VSRWAAGFLVGMLLLAVDGCGGAPRHGRTTPVPSSSTGTAATTQAPRPAKAPISRSDGDGDGDGGADDVHWGSAPSAAGRRAVTALAEAYYRAAGAENGAQACALLYSLFAEEVAETYGGPSAPAYLRGETCAVVLHRLFVHEHRKLVREAATLRVTGVRVKRLRGMALLHFGHAPEERDISVHLEHGVWKVSELLDVAPD